VEVEARIATLELAEPFVISRSARDAEEVVTVEVRHSGVAGFGEAAPSDRYGESAASALAYVTEHASLLGDDPFALDEALERLPPREYAARAALDAALHDLQGKLLGQPVWRLLGLRRAGPPRASAAASAGSSSSSAAATGSTPSAPPPSPASRTSPCRST
jgi:L-alanine-DL-glutamate epimerase-like enolase superfamily enzyme